MEIPLTIENLAKPWFRAVIGVLLIVAGFFFSNSGDVYDDITRENCVAGDGTIYDLRVDSMNGTQKRGMWIIFDDHDRSLVIHASCSSDELVSTMYKLEKEKTRLKFLYGEENGTIYELWADGKQLLDFETSKEKIDNNVVLIDYIGYVFIPLGALLVISSFIKFKKKASQ